MENDKEPIPIIKGNDQHENVHLTPNMEVERQEKDKDITLTEKESKKRSNVWKELKRGTLPSEKTKA